MKKNSIYCIQETWLDGDFVKEINGYIMFHHGLKKQICSRGQKGVAIILSPEFYNYYKLSGARPLIIPDNENNEEFGRFIGIYLSLHVKTNNKGAYSKKKE